VKSGEHVLLDSVILIDHFNGVRKATDFIRNFYGSSWISAITRAEVLTGFENPVHLQKASELLNRFPLVVIDAAVADLGAELRRLYRWKLPDALQAASAKVHELVLITRNIKDFPPEKYDFVRIPYLL
jgi:predicted nucleic acid-binding protein